MAPTISLPSLRTTSLSTNQPSSSHSTPSLQQPSATPVPPQALRIFKRPNRKYGKQGLPPAAEIDKVQEQVLTEAYPEIPLPNLNKSLPALPSVSKMSSCSLPSSYPPNLARPKTLDSTCALCQIPLTSALKTYAFPKTAPYILNTIRKLYTMKPPTPIFCLLCFEKLHELGICWVCGDVVAREEERVGCGWAWWHWGCVSCLLCRVSMSSHT